MTFLEMKRKIKLIWDFRGPDAPRTAGHFLEHLRESPLYSPERGSGVEAINEVHSIAFLVISEDEIPRYRDALRPHRATLAADEANDSQT